MLTRVFTCSIVAQQYRVAVQYIYSEEEYNQALDPLSICYSNLRV